MIERAHFLEHFNFSVNYMCIGWRNGERDGALEEGWSTGGGKEGEKMERKEGKKGVMVGR